ncbi:MAG: hypothetical protein RSB41_04145 [Bacilli bacterium]
MGLFFKKKKANNEDVNSKNIEILDLDDSSKSKDKVVNTLEERKNNRIILLSVGIILLFVLLLPSIVKIFKKDSLNNYGSGTSNENTNSSGYCIIGSKDASMNTKNIQFYNFNKTSDNNISFSYRSSSIITDYKSLGLYFELYNKENQLIFRTAFNPTEKIQKNIVYSYNIKVNDLLYKEAVSSSISSLTKLKSSPDEYLLCSKTTTDESFKLVEENEYGFYKTALVIYNSSSVAFPLPTTTEENKDKYNTIFKTNYNDLKKSNITDIRVENNKLIYSIDLLKIDLLNSNYKLLYNLASAKRTIKIEEEAKGWSCE